MKRQKKDSTNQKERVHTSGFLEMLETYKSQIIENEALKKKNANLRKAIEKISQQNENKSLLQSIDLNYKRSLN